MQFTKFEFKNFRGVKAATLDLSKSPKNSVNTLVGLNESGKTTVLEAINHFRSNPDLTRKNPNSRTRVDSDFQAMLPIAERALFNGEIVIKASLAIDAKEALGIDRFLKDTFGFVEVRYDKSFNISHKIFFENSKRKSTHNNWSLNFYGRKRKGKTAFTQLVDGDWLKAADFVETLLPKVMYFPASLLEFPDRIQLETKATTGDNARAKANIPTRNSFYFDVLKDVLRAVDARLDIEKHLIARAKSSTSADKQNLDAVILKIESHLNQIVLGEWRNTLGATTSNKSFRFYVNIDSDGLVYAEIKLFDGKSLFSLNERSAGFRWFFAFTLLVTYRVHRDDKVLFLFDEPAANLHPRAQSILLENFSSLSKTHQFIYTTHSHYLVNPLWLESTFIVKNEGVKQDVDFLEADPAASSITITPYRTFVGNHPEQYFYYKPVMDALEYAPAPLAPDRCSVLVEGKTDFYCIEYFKQVYFPGEFKVSLFPGGGSGTLDPLISLLAGWGVEFLILLDGDASGNGEAERYKEKFETLLNHRIETLSSLLKKQGQMKVESLFSSADKEMIRKETFPEEANLGKKLLHRAVQELLAGKRKLAFSSSTLDSFRLLLSEIEKRYEMASIL